MRAKIALVAVFLATQVVPGLRAQSEWENPIKRAPQAKKKVVITSRGPNYSQIGDKELADFKAYAPNVNIVVATEKEAMMAEVADADGIIGSITPEIIKAAHGLLHLRLTGPPL